MPGEVTFRPAGEGDLPAVLDLLGGDEISRSRVSAPADPDRLRAAFAAIRDDPRNELIVAESGGEVVGTCQLTYVPGLSRGGAERLLIEAVHVRSDRRGGGVGRAMMAWALDRGRDRGCALAQLTTDKRRTDAQRFYRSLGFAASHEGMKLSL